jgi:hypothetical protein
MSRFTYSYAECHYAGCHYAECHYAEYHYAECQYAECSVLFTAMLSVILLNVVMLNVIMLSVVAPYLEHKTQQKFCPVSKAKNNKTAKLKVENLSKTTLRYSPISFSLYTTSRHTHNMHLEYKTQHKCCSVLFAIVC